MDDIGDITLGLCNGNATPTLTRSVNGPLIPVTLLSLAYVHQHRDHFNRFGSVLGQTGTYGHVHWNITKSEQHDRFEFHLLNDITASVKTVTMENTVLRNPLSLHIVEPAKTTRNQRTSAPTAAVKQRDNIGKKQQSQATLL